MRRPILLFLAAVLVIYSCPFQIFASTDTRNVAVEEALAKAKPKDQPAELKEEPAAESEEPSADEYKQRLSQVIAKKEEPGEEPPQEIDAYVRVMPSAGARAMSGHLSVIESEFEYSYDYKLFGKMPLQFGLGTDYIGIKNTTDVSLPSRLTNIAFGAQATVPFFGFEKMYFRFGARPSFPTDNWRITSSAFRIPMQFFVIGQPNPKLTWVLGVFVAPSEETKIGPIAGLIYQYNDKLVFNIIPPRPQIIYSFNDKLDIFAEGGFSDDEFQVKKDGYKKAILVYKEMHLGGGLKYSLNKFIDTSLSVGGMFNRTLKYRDSLGKVNIQNCLYTEFRVEAQF
jgi:hypothetical protein